MDTEEMDHKQQDAGSLDETDAKLFTSKLFGGDKNESRQDVREENSEELADKLEKVEIKEEKTLDVLVTDKDEYPSDNVRRGVCLILENDMFHTNLGLSKRKGSSVDRQVMADTFTRLQFEVRIYSNLSVKEINNTLEKTALEDHSNRDMLAGNNISLTPGAQMCFLVLSRGAVSRERRDLIWLRSLLSRSQDLGTLHSGQVGECHTVHYHNYHF